VWCHEVPVTMLLKGKRMLQARQSLGSLQNGGGTCGEGPG
jgi:hypothetical protein